MTDVSADAQTQNDLAIPGRRRQQNRLAQQRARERRRSRRVTRRIEVRPQWLDALESRGFLNPFNRTFAEAEVEALERFLQSQLGGGI